MIPRVAERGRSFKGAGQYYLHDKGADTSERVAWTYAHNIPTEDPEKAMKWMAYTAMNAGTLKEQAGVAKTGRKSNGKSVYSYSLAWGTDQNPEKETMLQAALRSLGFLELEEHEAIIVAHQDTDHPHVHVIANLINPNDGRKANPHVDHIKFSRWAEEYERAEGKIRCEQRVLNNQLRRDQAPDGKEYGFVKHRDRASERKQLIQELYSYSDSGKAFNVALRDAGFTLAKGDRRGFVLVDDAGEIYSLSRQLKGQRAKQIRERLSDLDPESIPLGKEIASERQQQFEQEQDREGDEGQGDSSQADIQTGNTKKEEENETLETVDNSEFQYDDTHLRLLDAKRAHEQKAQRMRDQKEKELEEFYQRKKLDDKVAALRKKIELSQGFFARITGRLRDLEERAEALRLTLQNATSRMKEQRQALEMKIEQMQPAELQDNQKPPLQPGLTPEEEKAQRKDKLKKQLLEEQEQKRGRGKDRGLDI